MKLAMSFAAALSIGALVAQASAADKPVGVVPLVVSVAEENGKAVRDTAWIDAQIAQAERLFSPAGVHFKKDSTRTLPASMTKLETRADRDALAGEMQKSLVNVMIVGSLRDVDDPSRFRMGVHWRPTKTPKKHYVIVSASALGTTLAHELGHYFGLPHSDVVNNLMSYLRLGDFTFLDEKQKKTIVQFAKISIAAKEFTPLQLPSSAVGDSS